MVKVDCKICKETIFIIDDRYFDLQKEIGEVICSYCKRPQVFVSYVKSQYSLVQSSMYKQEVHNRTVSDLRLDSLQSQLTFNVSVIRLIINQGSNELAAKFLAFEESIQNLEPQMKKKLDLSAKRIQDQSQNVITRAIIEEVNYLNKYIKNVFKSNEQAFKNVTKDKQAVMNKMGDFPALDDEGKIIGKYYSSQDIIEVGKFFERKKKQLRDRESKLLCIIAQVDNILSHNRHA